MTGEEISQLRALVDPSSAKWSLAMAVSPDRVLLMSGQYLYDPVDAGDFPCSEFEVVRTASGSPLDLRCTGTPLRGVNERDARPEGLEFDSEFAEDGRVMSRPFEELL